MHENYVEIIRNAIVFLIFSNKVLTIIYGSYILLTWDIVDYDINGQPLIVTRKGSG